MFESYNEAVDWIHSRLKFGVKPGLKRMEWLLEKLGHPEKYIPTIHVAGTNGKGSTISYMLHMLTEAGYKVGSFTSPYIETFNERISVNGQPITDQEMLELVNEVKPFIEEIEQTELGGPTEFEIITTMMFLYFGKINRPDFLLLETGLGGRLDSTNIIHPILTVITNVGYDHMNILGETIEEIASEKAGIIKHRVPMITAVEDAQALNVITQKAKLHHAELLALAIDFTYTEQHHSKTGEVFSVQTPFASYENLVISMKGEHQIKNAVLALTAVSYLKEENKLTINENQIRLGLIKTFWKGRFERLMDNPEIIIDGAHNKEGVQSLIETLKRHYSNRKIHILYSALKDKDFSEMIARLSSVASSIHFTTFDFPRAAAAIELYSVCDHKNKTYSASWKSKLNELISLYKKDKNNVIIVTGSLYFISEVREYCLRELNQQ